MLEITKSLVLISGRLSKGIVEEAEKTFPVKEIKWKILLRAIAEAERSNGSPTSLVLVPPMTKITRRKGRQKKSLQSLSLFIDKIEKNRVNARILFPFYGEICQQDKILKILLEKLGCNNFSVESAGILMEIILPFIPVEVKYGGMNSHNGCGQKAFICPEEMVKVS